MEKLNKDSWEPWKERIKTHYPELTDEDLHYEEGKEEDLLHRIEDRIGKTAEEIIEWLREIGLGVY